MIETVLTGQLRRWTSRRVAALSQHPVVGTCFLILQSDIRFDGMVGWWCLESGSRVWWPEEEIEMYSDEVSE